MKIITNKDGLLIEHKGYKGFGGYYYDIVIDDYIISWYDDGALFLYDFDGAGAHLIRDINIFKPDLSLFKLGRYYSKDKVLKFIEKLDKLQAFT